MGTNIPVDIPENIFASMTNFGKRLCPASPEKEDQRAAGSPAVLTQLALCL